MRALLKRAWQLFTRYCWHGVFSGLAQRIFPSLNQPQSANKGRKRERERGKGERDRQGEERGGVERREGARTRARGKYFLEGKRRGPRGG